MLDDVGLVEGVRRSLRICRARPRESVAVVLALLLIVALTLVAFSNGFTDSITCSRATSSRGCSWAC